MAPASSSAASKPPAPNAGVTEDKKKDKGSQAKKEGKDKSNSQLALQMQAKLMRELRRQKDAPASVSSAALRKAIDAVAEKDSNWLKNACHWQDSRAHASFLGKARHYEIDLSSTGFTISSAPKKRTVVKKPRLETSEWERSILRLQDWSVPQLQIVNLELDARGVTLMTWATLRGLLGKVSSSCPLAALVPGHFAVRGEEDSDLDRLHWTHLEIVLVDGISRQPSNRKATLFQLGDGERVQHTVETDAGIGIQGAALKEVLCTAVTEYLTPSKLKEVKDDPLAFFKRTLDIPEGVPMYGLRTKDTHTEVIVKCKTSIADEYIFKQKKHNHLGLFLREIIREGTQTDESSSIIWIKNPEGLKATLAKAESICKEAFVIWRPGKMGVRFPNSHLAQARLLLMPSFLRPTEKALGVKGSISFIIEGLPPDFDPQDVVHRLSNRDWHVILGKPLKKATSLRVLADSPPEDLVIPNGKRPIVIRREFAPAIEVSDDEEDEEAMQEGDEEKDSQAYLVGPIFAPGWSAQATAPPLPSSARSVSPPVTPAAMQPSTNRSSKEEKVDKKDVHKKSTSNLSTIDASRIQQLEAAIAVIQTRQDEHDQKLQLNTQQLTTLGSSVEQLRGDNSNLMVMMQTMIQKQDDLLAQNRVTNEERRVRPRSSAGDCPSGLE
jgi:hypothetical protein